MGSRGPPDSRASTSPATSRSRSTSTTDAALFGVIDGLGHGPAAETAALRAVEAVTRARGERLEVLVQLCHRVLAGTRGVAMTLARVDFEAGVLAWTGVGNVTADLVAKAATGIHIRSSARLTAGHRRLPHTGNQAGTGGFDSPR